MAAPLRKNRASATFGHWLGAHLEAVGFWYLAAAYLLPVWAFAYLPTQDGPSHLANAEMILHYGASTAGVEEFFEFRPQCIPNWTSHLLLAGLLALFPPLIAEKLLVTLYVLGFAGGFRYFLSSFGPRCRPLSWMGLLFVYNRCFWMGFYNCCLSLVLFWFIVGLCVRSRGTLSLPRTALLAVLFTLAFFTHLVGFLLSLAGALGAVVLAPWTNRNEPEATRADAAASAPMPLDGHLAHLGRRLLGVILVVCAALPAVCLADDYFQESGFYRDGADSRLLERSRALAQYKRPTRFLYELQKIDQDLLEHYTGPRVSFSLMVAGWLVLLGTYTLGENLLRAEAGGAGAGWLFPLLFGAALLAAFPLLPHDLGGTSVGQSHGGFLRCRVALLPALLALACLREPANRIVRIGVRGLTVLLLGVNLVLVLDVVEQGNDLLAEYTAGMAAAGRDQRLFVCQADHGQFPLVNPLAHAASYYCVGTGNVNLHNYEAATLHFPLKFRRGVTSGGGSLARYGQRDAVDVVLCWNAPAPASWPGHPGWVRVFSRGPLQVYRRAPENHP